MELLEYLVRLRGAAEAGAEMRGLAGEIRKTSESATGLDRVGSKGMLAAKAVGGIGLAAIGVGLEAVKMANTFNHEMLRIRTDAGASTRELNRMKGAVLDLASSGQSMGQGPMSLAQGLYHLESLGIRGTKAIAALKLAAQESAISGASLEDTTSAMGGAMFTRIKGTGDLTRLMGILNATVGAGNMRFQDLNEALGTGVLPSAKIAGLSIQDVAAALAVATDSGYKASSAAAQLGTAFHFLYAPTDKATTALKSIHMSHNQLATDMHKPQGLLVALTDLRSHLSGLSAVARAQVLNAILPGGRGRILLTELTMLDRLHGKYVQINRTAGGFQGSVAAQRHDPQTQLAMGGARVQADMIRLGNVFSKYLTPALIWLENAGAKLLEWLAKIPALVSSVIGWTKRHMDIIKGVGAALAVLIGGFVAWRLVTIAMEAPMMVITAATAAWNFVLDANPIGIVIVALAALSGFLVYAWNHFKTFRNVVAAVWDWMKTAATDTAQWVTNAFNNVVNFFSGLPDAIAKIGSNLWNGLKGDLQDVVNWIIGVLRTMISGWNSLVGGIPIIGSSLTIGLPGFIGGGPPNQTQHPGIGTPNQHRFLNTPLHPVATNPPGGQHVRGLAHPASFTIHAHFDHPIVVDGREIARVHRKEIIKAMAAGA